MTAANTVPYPKISFPDIYAYEDFNAALTISGAYLVFIGMGFRDSKQTVFRLGRVAKGEQSQRTLWILSFVGIVAGAAMVWSSMGISIAILTNCIVLSPFYTATATQVKLGAGLLGGTGSFLIAYSTLNVLVGGRRLTAQFRRYRSSKRRSK